MCVARASPIGEKKRGNMTPDEKKARFRETDRHYVFYDKEEFYNVVKRFLFLSKSDSMKSLADYLDISVKDCMDAIQNCIIPVDWVLRMGFRLYEMINALSCNGPEYRVKNVPRFHVRYERFIGQLNEANKKKLTESVEKALLFDNPLAVDDATRKYLSNMAVLIKEMDNEA